MQKYILAIDHGTTSTRAVLFDKKANVVEIAQKETTISYPHPGWVEQDANEIWLNLLPIAKLVPHYFPKNRCRFLTSHSH